MKRAQTALVAVALLLLSGCGVLGVGDEEPSLNGEELKSPEDVLVDARRAFADAGSVHVTATARGSVRISGDLTRTSGQLTARSGEKVTEIRTLNSTTYLKAPAGYKNRGEPLPARLANTWTAQPTNNPEVRITLPAYFAGLDLPEKSVAPELVREQLSGRPVVVVQFYNGNRLTVSNTGSPVPLAFSSPKDEAVHSFDRFGAPVEVVAPPDPIQLSCGADDCDY